MRLNRMPYRPVDRTITRDPTALGRVGYRAAGLQSLRTSGAIPARRRPSALSLRVPRATAPELVPFAPFCPCCVLMRSIDRAVYAVPLLIAIRLQCVKQVFPLASLRPAIEAIEHRLPRPELHR